MNINTIIIAGRLTQSPEIKALPSGQNVCNFTIAVNAVYTKDGERKESTEFVNVVLFGKQAENTAKYLSKGDQALVEGKLQTRNYEKDGVKHYRTEVIGKSIQFGAKREPSKVPNTSVDYPEGPDPSEVPF